MSESNSINLFYVFSLKTKRSNDKFNLKQIAVDQIHTEGISSTNNHFYEQYTSSNLLRLGRKGKKKITPNTDKKEEIKMKVQERNERNFNGSQLASRDKVVKRFPWRP